MDFNLKGRSALITGSSKGIGLAIARTLAAEGCGTIHLSARNPAPLAEQAAQIQKDYGVEVVTHCVDLSRPEGVSTLAAVSTHVDILVNNAGAIPRGALLEMDEAEWREAWELKLFGFINLTREAYRAMTARGDGVILNVIGNAGERPNAAYVVGGTANAALMYFTEAVGGVSLDEGVRVLGLNPGPTTTERFVGAARTRAAAELDDPERWMDTLTALPMGRPATPEEVASLAVYLVSDQASYISGTVVRIDGGMNSRPPPQ
jgi:NAD(P)-dependent dehydrogenase (short-subunit alcohol dehydrogenase family)